MHSRKQQELAWHFSILDGTDGARKELIDAYRDSVVKHILGGFGNYLRRDLSLAHQAVWLSFSAYLNNPAVYQPDKGSLRCFLEVQSIKQVQKLLHEENRSWHFQQLDFVLARYFDNETDIMMAKLILRNEYSWPEFARLLDVGGLRTGLMLSEIGRNIRRITDILQSAPVNFKGMANRRRVRIYFRDEYALLAVN